MSSEMSSRHDSDDLQYSDETSDQTGTSGFPVGFMETDSQSDAPGSSASLGDMESTGQGSEDRGPQDSARRTLLSQKHRKSGDMETQSGDMETEHLSRVDVLESQESAGSFISSQEYFDFGGSLEAHSSFDVYEEPLEADDELTELTEEPALNRKLQPIRITKINVEHLVHKKEIISDKDNLHQAKNAIKKILRKKRQADGDSGQPQRKKSRLGKEQASTSQVPSSQESTDSSQIAPRFRELQLEPELHENLRQSGLDFELKLYLEEREHNSAFTNAVTDLLTEPSRQMLRQKKEVLRSFVFLFYRNIVQNERNKSIKPEIFALTTGFAWRVVAKYAEKEFTKLVERRTLEFPFHHVEFKRDSGPVLKETQSARPGQEIIFSVWDFLDKLIGNRRRKLRKDSSLCSSSLNVFRTKEGKPVLSKVDISEKSMKIRRSLTITQLGLVLNHFSKICCKDVTYTVEENGSITTNEEEDDKRFQMHDFVAKVADEKLRFELDNALHGVMEQSMKGTDSFIYLSHKEFELWTAAEEINLYARKVDTAGTENVSQIPSKKRNNRIKIMTWKEPPSLNAVMQALREHCSNVYQKSWLDDACIKFGRTAEPLKRFIFSRFNIEAVGSYIYHYGEWLEMKAEYLYQIEKVFVETMTKHMHDRVEELLLPWKHVGRKGEKGYKIQLPNLEQSLPKWKRHFEKICDSEPFDKVEDTVRSLIKASDDFKIDFQTFKGKTKAELAAYLYLLLECPLNEDDYNAAHTLLNMVKDDDRSMIVTCDKKTPHGIELCDILVDDDKTYLVHVKAGFEGGPMREVCSQIRNAAEHIFRAQTIARGTGIVDKYWQVVTKQSKNQETHENEVSRVLTEFGENKFRKLFDPERNIVFVLACRDTREGPDFTKDVGRNLDIEVTDAIAEKFKKLEPQKIIDRLTKEGYMTPTGTLTNKFILDGKGNQGKFVEQIRIWEEIKTEKMAKELFEILSSNLSRSKSTVAKMELIRLVKDFGQYWNREKKFELKICCIESDFPKP